MNIFWAKVCTDFIQSMIDCEEETSLEDKWSQAHGQGQIFITHDEMIAQGLQLFVAGHDTTSNTLTHLVYHLAANRNCQQILYEELKDVKDFSYESLSQLKYLNSVIKETLRLSPPVLIVFRKATKDITIKGNF